MEGIRVQIEHVTQLICVSSVANIFISIGQKLFHLFMNALLFAICGSAHVAHCILELVIFLGIFIWVRKYVDSLTCRNTARMDQNIMASW